MPQRERSDIVYKDEYPRCVCIGCTATAERIVNGSPYCRAHFPKVSTEDWVQTVIIKKNEPKSFEIPRGRRCHVHNCPNKATFRTPSGCKVCRDHKIKDSMTLSRWNSIHNKKKSKKTK